MEMAKKIIAVVGATGAQGGGLVRAILNDKSGEFAARALTRKTTGDKAQELAKAGAEVVAMDMDDAASVRKALEGAYDAGVQHVIWSTLEDTRKLVPLSDNRMPTLYEKYKVPHFDGKGEADAYFSQAGVPTTWLLTSFYWDNFIYFGMGPQAGPDGKLAITFPMGDKKLPGIAAEDIGKCALGIFKRPELIGKRVGIAGEHLTGTEMAAQMSKALGQEIAYNSVPPEVYRSFGFPGADDIGNMFQYKRDFEKEFTGARSVEFSREVNPELQTFETWLKKNGKAIPVGGQTAAAS
jgi:uncharacterized protein YbjT (DUF2867 family)